MARKTGGVPLKELMRREGPAFDAWIAEYVRKTEATKRLADKLRKIGARPDLKIWHLAEALVGHEITIDLVALLVAADREGMQRELVQDRSTRARKAAKVPRKKRDATPEKLRAFVAAYSKKHGKDRGAKKAAAAEFGIAASTVGRRLDK